MTTTPKARQDAWLALMTHLERSLIATREHARSSQKMAQAIRDDCGLSPGHTPEDWEATHWAAQRLLDDLGTIKVPVVPEDPFPGQEDILVNLGLVPPSTPGDNPGDETP